MFHVIAAIAEFDRDLIAERTRDGLAAARERHGGVLPVRGPSIDPGKLEVARELYACGELPTKRVAEIVGISRASLYRALPPGGMRRSRCVRPDKPAAEKTGLSVQSLSRSSSSPEYASSIT